MSYIIYILYSKSFTEFYIGHTEYKNDRLFRHNNSGSKSTKHAKDWELKHKEVFATRTEAIKREKEIKKKKSRNYIEWLIAKSRIEHPAVLP